MILFGLVWIDVVIHRLKTNLSGRDIVEVFRYENYTDLFHKYLTKITDACTSFYGNHNMARNNVYKLIFINYYDLNV